ncbi:MAG: hypothetical protein H0W50_06835 [Parachlamydiaceae bacterium]|nr:hypothetical protein [Parachlamydiaceae bacterium]
MAGDIKRLYLAFNVYKNFDLKEARELIVKKEEQYLKILNESKEVRPYLHHYPAGSRNFELPLTFKSSKEDFAYPLPPNMRVLQY